MQSAATNRAVFVIGRVIIGVAVTLNNVAAPTYVAELSLPKYRGLLTGLYMAAWFIAAIVASGLIIGTYNIPNTWSWRITSIVQAVPSLLSLPTLPFMPESPRYLINLGRDAEALKVLADYHGNGDPRNEFVEAEFLEIKQTLHAETAFKTTWVGLFQSTGNRWRMMIIILMGLFSQFSGSNLVGVYISQIMEQAGVTGELAQMNINITVQVANLFAAIAGSFFTEIWGRRPILLSCSFLMAIVFFIIGALLSVYGDNSKDTTATPVVIVFIYIFNVIYSFSFIPLSTSYPVEIVSYGIRTKGMSLTQIVTYSFAFINQYLLPLAIDHIGWKLYMINAGFNVAQTIIIYLLFVETKGRTLEEVDILFDSVEGSGSMRKRIKNVILRRKPASTYLDHRNPTPDAENDNTKTSSTEEMTLERKDKEELIP